MMIKSRIFESLLNETRPPKSILYNQNNSIWEATSKYMNRLGFKGDWLHFTKRSNKENIPTLQIDFDPLFKTKTRGSHAIGLGFSVEYYDIYRQKQLYWPYSVAVRSFDEFKKIINDKDNVLKKTLEKNKDYNSSLNYDFDAAVDYYEKDIKAVFEIVDDVIERIKYEDELKDRPEPKKLKARGKYRDSIARIEGYDEDFMKIVDKFLITLKVIESDEYGGTVNYVTNVSCKPKPGADTSGTTYRFKVHASAELDEPWGDEYPCYALGIQYCEVDEVEDVDDMKGAKWNELTEQQKEEFETLEECIHVYFDEDIDEVKRILEDLAEIVEFRSDCGGDW